MHTKTLKPNIKHKAEFQTTYFTPWLN